MLARDRTRRTALTRVEINSATGGRSLLRQAFNLTDHFVGAVQQAEEPGHVPAPPPQHHDTAVGPREEGVGTLSILEGDMGVHRAPPLWRTAGVQRGGGRYPERVRMTRIERRHTGDPHGITFE